MENPILNRLNPKNTINDKVPGQGMPLICLATISTANQPGYYYVNKNTVPITNITYNALGNSYSGGTLVFNSYGSLTDSVNYGNPQLANFFMSPFDPSYPNNISPPIPGDTMDVINGVNNAFVYGLIANFKTRGSMSGSTFVSPRNSKWILNVSSDRQGNNIYKIFFNPLQNPNVSAESISKFLPSFCDIVSNADPMCFCDTSNAICTQAAFNNKNTDNISQTSYQEVAKNCACLNNQCRFAVANQTNEFVNGLSPCGKTSACGKTFSYSNTYGVGSDQNNATVFTACGGNGGGGSSGGDSGGDSGGGSSGGGSSGGDTPKASGMGTGEKIGITIAAVLIMLAIAYYFMM